MRSVAEIAEVFPIFQRTQKVGTGKCQGSAGDREAALSNNLVYP